MKILYWIPLFWPDTGGIQTLAMKLLPGLQARGYEIIVVTSHGRFDLDDETDYKGIPVYRFPIVRALAENDLRQVIATLREISALKQTLQPDLVHISFGMPSIVYFHLKTSIAHPVPTLLTIHANLAGYDTGPGTLLGDILRQADWVTSDSEATLGEARRIYPGIVDHSSVVYSGLDMPDLEPADLDLRTPHIVCLGRLAEEKGFDLAIAAFAHILERFPEAHLTIAGDGPARPDLERQARERGVDDRVRFPGWIAGKQVPALLNTATIVVVPSRVAESFPVVSLEAAQMARPIVAARVGGLPESVIHRQTGLLVDKDDHLAIAEAISYLLDNPGEASQMGQTGRSRAQSVFSWERFVDTYDSLYQKITSESR
jgi:glycogen(starch) synthase